MDDLLRALASHRRRIRMGRAASTAARWAFALSVLACVYLAASKVAGLSLPRSAAVTALVAIPLAMAAREWARAFSLRDCAIHLDLALALEERLSTAVDCGGPMRDLQAADAAGALARAGRVPLRVPREAKLLPVSVLLLLALLAIPALERSGARNDPALEALLASEAAGLEAVAPERLEFREVADLLRRGRAEEALRKLEALREALELSLLRDGAGRGGATAKALDAAGAAAEALSAQLARMGRTVHARPPASASAKLARQEFPAVAEEPASASDPEGVRAVAARLARADWDPRYDSVVRKYFGSVR